MDTATRIDAIPVVDETCIDGVTVIETPCPDADAFAALPTAVSWGGRTLGRTGWNSDRGRAYYRSDARIAMPVR